MCARRTTCRRSGPVTPRLFRSSRSAMATVRTVRRTPKAATGPRKVFGGVAVGGTACDPFNFFGSYSYTAAGDPQRASILDPYRFLPTPSGTCPVSGGTNPGLDANGKYPPGVYPQSLPADAALEPGVFVLCDDVPTGLTGTGVMLYLARGQIHWNGGDSLTALTAANTGPYAGVAIWQPKQNTADLSINGGAALTLSPTASGDGKRDLRAQGARRSQWNRKHLGGLDRRSIGPHRRRPHHYRRRPARDPSLDRPHARDASDRPRRSAVPDHADHLNGRGRRQHLDRQGPGYRCPHTPGRAFDQRLHGRDLRYAHRALRLHSRHHSDGQPRRCQPEGLPADRQRPSDCDLDQPGLARVRVQRTRTSASTAPTSSTARSRSFSGPGITVNATTWVSATRLTANITIAAGAAPGARDVAVTNPDSGVGSGNGVFTVNAGPTVTSTNPGSLGQGATNQNVTINGNNFVNGAVAAFSGTGITVNATTWVSATRLTANITIAAGRNARCPRCGGHEPRSRRRDRHRRLHRQRGTDCDAITPKYATERNVRSRNQCWRRLCVGCDCDHPTGKQDRDCRKHRCQRTRVLRSPSRSRSLTVAARPDRTTLRSRTPTAVPQLSWAVSPSHNYRALRHASGGACVGARTRLRSVQRGSLCLAGTRLRRIPSSFAV